MTPAPGLASVPRVPTDFTLRDADSSDFGVAAELRAMLNPDRIISLEGMRVMMGGLPERAQMATWVAEVDGVPAGWAMALRAWTQPDPTIGTLDVVVHPDHRRTRTCPGRRPAAVVR